MDLNLYNKRKEYKALKKILINLIEHDYLHVSIMLNDLIEMKKNL